MSDFNALVQYTVENISRPVKYIIYKLTEFIRVVDKFVFRQVPAGAASGYATIEQVEGNTVVWNQLLKQGKLVDMGLPSGLLWATCNIDITQEDGFAASPFQYGCTMFSWGNIEGHNTPASGTTFDYNWGSVNVQEPWYEGQPYGSTPGAALVSDIVANDSQDAARKNVGSLFKMPSSSQFQELIDNCIFIDANGDEIPSTATDKRATVNGIVGLYLQSRANGNRLFFSASGVGNGSSWSSLGASGYYWSASFYTSRNARNLYFSSGGVRPQNGDGRFFGFVVRPVVVPSNTSEVGHDDHKFCLTSNKKNMVDLTLLGIDDFTTVEQVEGWLAENIGTLPYYDYNAGELISCKMQSVKSVGFNQWDEIGRNGYYNSTTGAYVLPSGFAANHYCNSNPIRVLPNTRYSIKVPAGKSCIVFFYEETSYISPTSVITTTGTFVTPLNCSFINFYVGDYGTTYNNDICINISDPAKNGTYQPYQSDSADIDATTITGINPNTNTREVMFSSGMKQADREGTVKDELDLVNGTATVRCKEIDLGTPSWTNLTSYNLMITTNVIFDIKVYNPKYLTTLDYANYIGSVSSMPDLSMGFNIDKQLRIKDVSKYGSMTAAQFQTAMTGVKLIYELATPITYTDLQDANGNPLNPRYKVEQGGTEQVLPVNTSTPTTVAPTLTTTYTKNVH